MNRWGRQSPIEQLNEPSPPPLPPKNSINIVRQSSFKRLGSILNSTKNGITKRSPSKLFFKKLMTLKFHFVWILFLIFYFPLPLKFQMYRIAFWHYVYEKNTKNE